MNILVNSSERFAVTPNGQFWAPSENFAYGYWTRFLDVFGEVSVVGRSFEVNDVPKGARPASGDCVSVLPLPNYNGVRQLARQYFSIQKLIAHYVSDAQAIALLVPCTLGDLVWRSLQPRRPYGVIVCGDPHDVLAPGTVQHPLRPILRWWSRRSLQQECRSACACSYVTRIVLQSRYPCRNDAFSTSCSNIDLSDDAIVAKPRTAIRHSRPFHLISVGTFDRLYKGPDTLVEAVSLCAKRNINIKLTFVGDGRMRAKVEELVQQLGLASCVRFTGLLRSSAAVRCELDAADLFVLPSRVEGLPKALVEAMARGLPCIGSNVGGIPELLPVEDLVAANDPASLAHRIEDVLRNPERLQRMSSHNLAKAQQYRSTVLREHRIGFYSVLRSHTAQWLAQPMHPLLRTNTPEELSQD